MNQSQFLIYISESGLTKIDVRLEDETVWLSQKKMAELYQVTSSTINEHIKNIYEEGELPPDRTIRNFRIVQKEGKREVERDTTFYNLDMILSVGKTAAEIIYERANSSKPNMDLTNFRGEKFLMNLLWSIQKKNIIYFIKK